MRRRKGTGGTGLEVAQVQVPCAQAVYGVESILSFVDLITVSGVG
jgi:hypothetical protein